MHVTALPGESVDADQWAWAPNGHGVRQNRKEGH
jgi:hypothetical protein